MSHHPPAACAGRCALAALPEPLIETLKAEDIKVMISLDGVGEQHDRQRPTVNGRASFALVEARGADALVNWAGACGRMRAASAT